MLVDPAAGCNAACVEYFKWSFIFVNVVLRSMLLSAGHFSQNSQPKQPQGAWLCPFAPREATVGVWYAFGLQQHLWDMLNVTFDKGLTRHCRHPLRRNKAEHDAL